MKPKSFARWVLPPLPLSGGITIEPNKIKPVHIIFIFHATPDSQIQDLSDTIKSLKQEEKDIAYGFVLSFSKFCVCRPVN